MTIAYERAQKRRKICDSRFVWIEGKMTEYREKMAPFEHHASFDYSIILVEDKLFKRRLAALGEFSMFLIIKL